jgi:hypothetical protein
MFNAIAEDCGEELKKWGYSFCWIGEEKAGKPQAEGGGKLNGKWVKVTGWKTPEETIEFPLKAAYIGTEESPAVGGIHHRLNAQQAGCQTA